MSVCHDGCQLTMSEIAAVVSLAGKRTMVGFSTEELRNLTAEKMWSACCDLMGDGMMTQIDGRFRLSRELMDVMYPICHGGRILSLTPGSDLNSQMVFYCAETVTAMKQTPFGRYVLTALEPAELADMIYEHMELEDPDILPGAVVMMPELPVCNGSTSEELLSGARFLVEALDTAGNRTGWMRLMDRGVYSWLQWTESDRISCCPLTKDNMSDVIKKLL